MRFVRVEKKGYYFLGSIAALYVFIIARFLMIPSGDYSGYLLRLSALTGLFFLSVTTLLTPFVRRVSQIFGKPFMKIHHVFGAIGLASATLHPIILFLRVGEISIFVPDVSSWYNFWLFAGRPALFIMYFALVVVLLRKMIPKYWRAFHSLMYVVLFFSLVHGILIGTDFVNLGIFVLFSGLFIASIGGFVYKRLWS